MFGKRNKPDLSLPLNVEYKIQSLEPLGGKIKMPTNWFYNEYHKDSSFVWILSEEDSKITPRITSVSIQVMTGFEKEPGNCARKFLTNFMNKRKNEVEFIDIIEPVNIGMFTSFGFESIEPATHLGQGKEYRVRTSLFWGNGMDMAVVMVSGTLKENWEKYSDCFDEMSQIEMIDMSRF